jgi:hypothetical protein
MVQIQSVEFSDKRGESKHGQRSGYETGEEQQKEFHFSFLLSFGFPEDVLIIR